MCNTPSRLVNVSREDRFEPPVVDAEPHRTRLHPVLCLQLSAYCWFGSAPPEDVQDTRVQWNAFVRRAVLRTGSVYYSSGKSYWWTGALLRSRCIVWLTCAKPVLTLTCLQPPCTEHQQTAARAGGAGEASLSRHFGHVPSTRGVGEPSHASGGITRGVQSILCFLESWNGNPQFRTGSIVHSPGAGV